MNVRLDVLGLLLRAAVVSDALVGESPSPVRVSMEDDGRVGATHSILFELEKTLAKGRGLGLDINGQASEGVTQVLQLVAAGELPTLGRLVDDNGHGTSPLAPLENVIHTADRGLAVDIVTPLAVIQQLQAVLQQDKGLLGILGPNDITLVSQLLGADNAVSRIAVLEAQLPGANGHLKEVLLIAIVEDIESTGRHGVRQLLAQGGLSGPWAPVVDDRLRLSHPVATHGLIKPGQSGFMPDQQLRMDLHVEDVVDTVRELFDERGLSVQNHLVVGSPVRLVKVLYISQIENARKFSYPTD